MPEKIIKQFEKEYGKKKGKKIFYSTAKAQHRDPHSFKKLKETIKSIIEDVLKEDDSIGLEPKSDIIETQDFYVKELKEALEKYVGRYAGLKMYEEKLIKMDKSTPSEKSFNYLRDLIRILHQSKKVDGKADYKDLVNKIPFGMAEFIIFDVKDDGHIFILPNTHKIVPNYDSIPAGKNLELNQHNEFAGEDTISKHDAEELFKNSITGLRYTVLTSPSHGNWLYVKQNDGSLKYTGKNDVDSSG